MKKKCKKINGISMFSNVGIGELFLKRNNIKIVGASELLEERARFYKEIFPGTEIVVGDIRDKKNFQKLVDIYKKNKCKFLIATPPCQGMSIAGKMSENDPRNNLIKYVINFIKIVKPENALIENVPGILKFSIKSNGKSILIKDYIKNELKKYNYIINYAVLDAADYKTPQHRKRAIFLISKQNWYFPKKNKHITVEEAIGDLPSLESGEISTVHKYHRALSHNKNHILWMKNTPTGKTAHENKNHFPQKVNGEKIKGFSTTYKRISWDTPAPTITMCNGAISSQNNVHPGRKKGNIYTDARALTILELMRLSGIKDNWKIPSWASESLIRKVIGESFPPKFCEEIIKVMPRYEK